MSRDYEALKADLERERVRYPKGSFEVLAIPADGAVPVYLVTIPTKLYAMQALVGGGYIEGVSIPNGRMYCDEEGLLKELPYNSRATRLRQHYLAPAQRSYAVFAGDVFVSGPIINDGDDSSVTPSVIKDFYELS